MEIENLLKPRIKVIADFWDNPFKVGDVIQFVKEEDLTDWLDQPRGRDWLTDYIENDIQGFSTKYELKQFAKYPHLFKKLQWWEERKPEEMPEYVKFYMPLPEGFCIRKVNKYEPTTTGMCVATCDKFRYYLGSEDVPAAETEYNDYMASKETSGTETKN